MKRLVEKQKRRIKRKMRIRKKITGVKDRPRLSVYRSLKHIYIQAIDDTSGETLTSVSNIEPDLRKLKNSTANAEKLGEIIGKRMKEKKITQVVFDRNSFLYHGVVKAVADGVRKSGITL